MQVKQRKSQKELIQELQQQVDELTAANLLLKDQLVRREQFLAMIAHELRGPLSPIINYAQMIARFGRGKSEKSDTYQTARQQENIQRNTNIIISQARRLARLVNDLLDASRLSTGQFSLERKTCNMVTLVKEVVDQLRPVAPYHTFVTELPENEINGNWDGERLQQALGNLLDNAIKYSDERTTITVRVWTTASKVFVSVHNQGIGIASSEAGKLFLPYTRLEATSERKGSGLGLYITKSIIEAHGGKLRLEPLNEESVPYDDMSGFQTQGTTFTFELAYQP